MQPIEHLSCKWRMKCEHYYHTVLYKKIIYEKKEDLCEIKLAVLASIKFYHFSVSGTISWWTCISAIPFDLSETIALRVFQPSHGKKWSLASTCCHWQRPQNSQAYFNITKATEVNTF